jgi:N6-adenosine-specific RNA methylase IME4
MTLEFGTINIDTPWHEPGGSGRGTKYRTVRSVGEAFEVIVKSPAWRPAPICHVYVWQTATHYAEALELLGLLADRLASVSTWVKVLERPALGRRERRLGRLCVEEDRHHTGTGQYFLHCAEWALLGVRGPSAVPVPEDRLHSVFYGPRGGEEQHSAKPEKFYQRAVRTSPGPRVDMFARSPRKDWWTWGDEMGPDLHPPL